MKVLLFVFTFFCLFYFGTTTNPSWDNLNFYRSLAYSSYCSAPNAGLKSWSCYWCNKSIPITVKLTFSGGDNVFGYMAIARDGIYVVFRGTVRSSIQNWITDLDFNLIAYPYCANCEVHHGFYQSYLEFSDLLYTNLIGLMRQYPDLPVKIVGHSLGGALATLFAANLSYYNIPTTLVTFGSPRVGNGRWASWFQSLRAVVESWRVTNQRDIVPHIPAQMMFFQHICTEMWFFSDFTRFKVCGPYCEDSSCSNSQINTSIKDHLTYLGYDLSNGNPYGC